MGKFSVSSLEALDGIAGFYLKTVKTSNVVIY